LVFVVAGDSPLRILWSFACRQMKVLSPALLRLPAGGCIFTAGFPVEADGAAEMQSFALLADTRRFL